MNYPAEAVRLEDYESIIERGLASFCEVGNALLTIRERGLYKETHRAFESYCKERWGMTKSRANQLVGAARTIENLATIVAKPATESVVRPLTSLPKEEQVGAWQEAVETAPEGRVTAKHVQETVEKIEARKNLPKFKKPEVGWVSGSQAMNHAGSAILQLERISADDPMRKKAFKHVTEWINNQLTKGGGSRG